MTDEVHPLRVLRARAEARAMLWSTNEFDLEEALDPLFRYAIESGLIDECGVDVVMPILRAAFAGRAEL